MSETVIKEVTFTCKFCKKQVTVSVPAGLQPNTCDSCGTTARPQEPDSDYPVEQKL